MIEAAVLLGPVGNLELTIVGKLLDPVGKDLAQARIHDWHLPPASAVRDRAVACWRRMMLLNTTGADWCSSDRMFLKYARLIWPILPSRG